MKKAYLILPALLFLSMIVLPLAAVGDNSYMIADSSGKPSAITTASVKQANATVKKEKQSENVSAFKVKFHKSGKIQTVDVAEYLIGVTAAEMDIECNIEALKAQAVAAHTLALFRKNENKAENYDITDDSSTDQSYLPLSERKKKWGENYEKNEKKLQSAIISVLNKTIQYENKPILAVYCDTSSGKTESAENVWGGKYPYLVPVESVSDMLSPQYLSTVTYTDREFSSLCSGLGLTLNGDKSKWVGNADCTPSGTVKTQKIADKSFSGGKIREIFNLRSANFDLEYRSGKFVFTVRGYGHGVGMSQFGADYMAKQGSKYDEILLWYYTDCKICG